MPPYDEQATLYHVWEGLYELNKTLKRIADAAEMQAAQIKYLKIFERTCERDLIDRFKDDPSYKSRVADARSRIVLMESCFPFLREIV
jgi:hypothetical protein